MKWFLEMMYALFWVWVGAVAAVLYLGYCHAKYFEEGGDE